MATVKIRRQGSTQPKATGKRMSRLDVARFFEVQNLNLECEKHVKAAHALMTEYNMNPPEVKTILGYKRSHAHATI